MSQSPNDEPKGPLGYSQAHKSTINSPDEEKSAANIALEKLIQDQRQQREEIDSVKVGMQQLIEKIEQIIQAVNNQTVALGGGKEIPTDKQGNMSNLMGLKELLDSKLGEKLIDRVFPEQTAAPSFIDASYINEHLKKSVMGNFEVGEALIDSLKDKIVKKAITKSVSQIVTDSHEPE